VGRGPRSRAVPTPRRATGCQCSDREVRAIHPTDCRTRGLPLVL
jgi:hypothetical protein